MSDIQPVLSARDRADIAQFGAADFVHRMAFRPDDAERWEKVVAVALGEIHEDSAGKITWAMVDEIRSVATNDVPEIDGEGRPDPALMRIADALESYLPPR